MKNVFLNWTVRGFVLISVLLLTLRNIRQATYVGAFGDNVGSGDFIWDSSRAVLLHIDPYLQSPAWEPIEKEKNDFMWATYAPSSLVLILPFADLNWATARNLWLVFNLCMTLFILTLIRKTWLSKISWNQFLVFSLLAYASGPWRDIFRLGQETLYALGFFLLGYRLALAKRPISAGILLSLSLIKYTLTGPYLLWMALTGLGISVGIAVLLQCVLTVFSFYWLGIGPWRLFREYIESVRKAAFQGCTDLFSFSQNLTLSRYHTIVIALGVLGITAALLWWWKQRERDSLLELAVISVWSMLVAYHGYYDMITLVFTVTLVFRDGIASRLHLILAIFIAELWYSIAQRLTSHLQPNMLGGLATIMIFPEILVLFVFLLCVKTPKQANAKQAS